MNRSKKMLAALTITVLLVPAVARAQATRTWVSGVGDDANPCSRTAPCKTFAGAISKTAAGGEISVLDPGGFGAVTITKSITINGEGTLAGILSSLVSGVIVNAGVNDVIRLRNLHINGAGNGTNGIRYLSAGSVIVENCTFTGITTRLIEVNVANNANLSVRNSTLTGASEGVRLLAGTNVRAHLENVTIKNSQTAIFASVGATTVSNSVLTQNNLGVFASGGIVNLESSQLTGNNTAASTQPSSTIRVANSAIYDNSVGFGCGGGALLSAGNNRVEGNGASCAPTGSITIQ